MDDFISDDDEQFNFGTNFSESEVAGSVTRPGNHFK